MLASTDHSTVFARWRPHVPLSPNDMSIGSAIFAELTRVSRVTETHRHTDRQTDRDTDRATVVEASVGTTRIYQLQCWRCGLKGDVSA